MVPEVGLSSSQYMKTDTLPESGWCLLETSTEKQLEHHCVALLTALQGSVNSLVTARAPPFHVKVLEEELKSKALKITPAPKHLIYDNLFTSLLYP